MSEDASTDPVNPSKEMLLETIDRNKRRTWTEYAERFQFTLRGDELVEMTAADDDERTATVTLAGGRAVTCSCYSHATAFGRTDCRHMRAVDAHPRL
ncbi:hypothetical protein [Halalkalicoccus subterraneus]|uniref:hypothetical protein n=1 Tax=Halalkalicoccus subterraneus TaxID=2675002 RepID=UPI000EFCEFDC|nr:hypothetical protein [Halalkalicoccus subterraneus]